VHTSTSSPVSINCRARRAVSSSTPPTAGANALGRRAIRMQETVSVRSRWDSLHRVQPDASSQPHASRKRVVATFPPLGETSNPYQRLLYEALAETGVRLAPSGKLRSKWLWENRREVGILHFHWLSGYYRHPRLAGQVVRLLLFAQRLLLARALRYRVVWTVHEIDPHDRQCRADSV